jgi:hypothetical protein
MDKEIENLKKRVSALEEWRDAFRQALEHVKKRMNNDNEFIAGKLIKHEEVMDDLIDIVFPVNEQDAQ